jgi:hypothetical protein
MSYRAVPLRDLLADLPPDATNTIEARASDGFVSQLPRAIIKGAAVPCVPRPCPAPLTQRASPSKSLGAS